MYLPGLQVHMIFERDFTVAERATIEFARTGYRLRNETELTQFTRREDCILGQTIMANCAGQVFLLPDSMNKAVQKCPGSSSQKQWFTHPFEPFPPMFTERP